MVTEWPRNENETVQAKMGKILTKIQFCQKVIWANYSQENVTKENSNSKLDNFSPFCAVCLWEKFSQIFEFFSVNFESLGLRMEQN